MLKNLHYWYTEASLSIALPIAIQITIPILISIQIIISYTKTHQYKNKHQYQYRFEDRYQENQNEDESNEENPGQKSKVSCVSASPKSKGALARQGKSQRKQLSLNLRQPLCLKQALIVTKCQIYKYLIK